jgi:hypothetical protein
MNIKPGVEKPKRQPLYFEAGRRPVEQLVGMAAAARANGFEIIFSALQTRAVSDLVKIAAAGGRWLGRSDRSPSQCRSPRRS